MHLYEIADEYRHILADAESKTPEEVLSALDAIQARIEDKVRAVVHYIANTDAEAEAFRVEEDRLAARREAMVNRSRAMRDYIAQQMRRMDITEVKAGTFTLKFKKNPPALVVDNAEDIPAQYWKPQPPALDRRALLADAKEGMIDGVHVEQGERLDIR